MEQIKDLMKNIISCVSAQATNIEKADTKELSEAMDMIKDLAMAEYYCVITKAMENPENEYGKNWDENGPIKGYERMYPNMRMRRGYEGEMMPKSTMTYGTRYGYEEPMMMNQNTSQYDRARRGYEEHKDMSSLNRIFDIIEADMKELKPTMTAQDKQTAHQRLTTLSNMMNV